MMTACNLCCKKPSNPTDRRDIIVVQNTEIKQNADGSYTVTKDWFLSRMSKEQKLMEALNKCVKGKQQ